MFADDLKQKGWIKAAELRDYEKGDWRISFDSSSWMMVETKNNPRVFDVHVPGDYESGWTVNLIEHLCKMEDERQRLREALERIRNQDASGPTARSIAQEALEQCYHTWLINPSIPEGQPGRIYCPVCKQTKSH